MSANKQQAVRERIGKVIELNPNMSRSEVVKHFELEGIPKRTVQRWYNNFKNGMSAQRKVGSGQHNAVPDNIKKKIVEECVNEKGLSYRLIGRKYGYTHITIKSILEEYDVQRSVTKKVPKSTENQKKVQKIRLNRVRKTYLAPKNELDVVMDDEAYFTVDGSEYKKNAFYYHHKCLEVPEEVRYKPVTKFPKKVMVWITMSAKGFSTPFIIKSGNAVKSVHYINQCLPKLKKILAKHHSDHNYIFWPDLASSHYSHLTQEAFNRLNIKFLPKEDNPPNIPQLRPIEKFWAILKQKLYANNWTTDNYPELIARIKKCIKNMPQNLSQNLMRKVKTNVRKGADRGPLSLIN